MRIPVEPRHVPRVSVGQCGLSYLILNPFECLNFNVSESEDETCPQLFNQKTRLL